MPGPIIKDKTARGGKYIVRNVQRMYIDQKKVKEKGKDVEKLVYYQMPESVDPTKLKADKQKLLKDAGLDVSKTFKVDPNKTNDKQMDALVKAGVGKEIASKAVPSEGDLNLLRGKIQSHVYESVKKRNGGREPANAQEAASWKREAEKKADLFRYFKAGGMRGKDSFVYASDRVTVGLEIVTYDGDDFVKDGKGDDVIHVGGGADKVYTRGGGNHVTKTKNIITLGEGKDEAWIQGGGKTLVHAQDKSADKITNESKDAQVKVKTDSRDTYTDKTTEKKKD